MGWLMKPQCRLIEELKSGGKDVFSWERGESRGSGFSDENAVCVAFGKPGNRAGIAAEPRHAGCSRHRRDVKGAGIAAEVQTTALDEGDEVGQIEGAFESVERFKVELPAQVSHFVGLSRIAGAGQDDGVGGMPLMEGVERLGENRSGKFFVVLSGEGADVNPAPLVAHVGAE